MKYREVIQHASVTILFLFLAMAFWTPTIVRAAPGDLDLTFNAGPIIQGNGGSEVKAIAIQPDGKILIGGYFATVNGTARNIITRLNSDGSLDLTFNTTLQSNAVSGDVRAIVLQPDGKILVGGTFVVGIEIKKVVRLNADGSLDGSFNPDELGGSFVSAIVIQPDGKIIIGGQIGNYSGVSGRGIVRLNQNGSLDTGLGLAANLPNDVYAIALQEDGKIIAGGNFFVIGSSPLQSNIARLNANGTLDSSFVIGSGTNNIVNAIAVQPDNKILIAGFFSSVNGATHDQIARINSDGSLDSLFTTSITGSIGVFAMRLQPDGKIIVGGGLGLINGVQRRAIGRLNANGSLDSFYPQDGVNDLIRAIAYQPCSKILIGGAFANVSLVSRSRLARLIDAPRRSVADNDGDGCTDLSVFRPSTAAWYLSRSTSGFTAQQFGISTDRVTPADYDGDGKSDIAVWREAPATQAAFYIFQSATNTVRTEQFGQTGDDPAVVGDFDGDGKADVAVYRNAAFGNQSYFFYRGSLNNPSGSVSYVLWGINGDKAVRGDFDGDGKADAAVFRPSDRTWYVLRSSDGAIQAQQFGLTTDKLVPADYDGDGKADIAVFRPSDGNWYVLGSSLGNLQIINWGLSSDVPVPGDYDGDGQTDFAVYRNGLWYLLRSTSGIGFSNFGLIGDIPTNQIQ